MLRFPAFLRFLSLKQLLLLGFLMVMLPLLLALFNTLAALNSVYTAPPDINYAPLPISQNMLYQALLLLSISTLLGGLIIAIMMPPIQQLNNAIKGLGKGDYVRNIKVTGPSDMEFLGERLNWLRVRLKNLEDEKHLFFRNVSHELKTPLATIHEGAALMADNVVGKLNAEQTEIIQLLQSSSKRLDKLIADIITFSQMTRKQGNRGKKKISIRALIYSVLKDYQIISRSRSITLQTHMESISCTVIPTMLRTIVDNLLSNAIKHSPNGSNILISLRRGKNHFILDIEDEGPGITEKEINRVFDAFYQGRATRKAGIKGSGLGLAIVRECVAAHQGIIEAMNREALLKGAKFRVVIPLRQDSKRA